MDAKKKTSDFVATYSRINQVRETIREEFDYEFVADGRRAELTIVFDDGKFSKVVYPFLGSYTEDQWAILSQIHDEIQRLKGD